MIQFAEQLGKSRPAVEIDSIIGHILRNKNQFPDAVAGKLAGLVHHPLDRLGHVLAPHVGDCTESAKPITSLGDLQVGEMPRGDSQAGAVVLSLHRRRAEDRPLLMQAAQNSLRDLRDLLAAEHAHDLVDLGELVEQYVFLTLGQAAGDNDPPDLSGAFAVEQFLDHAARFLTGRVDEPAGIDDHQIRLLPLGNQHEPVLGQQPQHALGIHEVLGAAKTDKRDGPFWCCKLAHAFSEISPPIEREDRLRGLQRQKVVQWLQSATIRPRAIFHSCNRRPPFSSGWNC